MSSKNKDPDISKEGKLSDAWAEALSPGGLRELRRLAEFRKSRRETGPTQKRGQVDSGRPPVV